MEFIYTIDNLRKAYDQRVLLDEITLSFLPDAKIGVIGKNGAGKSTFLRILAGVEKTFDGLARPADGITIGYVPQEPTLDPALDVRGNLEKAVAPVRALLTRHDELNEKLAEDLDADAMQKVLDQLAAVQDEIEHKNAWELDRAIDLAMHAMQLPPSDADVTKLSGGEKRRVALCDALMAHPDLLLLDEPTNHLDPETVTWLEHFLADYKGCVILITHDRYFLDNVVGWMLEIENGKGIPYKGNYSAYLEQKQIRLDANRKQAGARSRLIGRELAWLRTNPKARTTKNKARVKNYARLVAEEQEAQDGPIELQIPPGPRLGDRVLTLNSVHKEFGDKILLADASFDLPPGGIVGVTGPNGVGKTTLIKMIIGDEAPDGGTIEIGGNTVVSYLDQTRETLDADKTVFEEITGGGDEMLFGNKPIASRAYVARFLFTGADQQKKVGDLSGGERNRVQLAKLLRKGGNLILLDEPTNDLDLPTLRVLEESLQAFSGCAVVVSHDRFFLDRVATHILAFEGDGKVRFFFGSYADYHDKLEAERAASGEGSPSKKGKHRKMGRV